MVALVVGVANKDSIAYGIARALKYEGHKVILTYQNAKTRKFTEALAEEMGTADEFYEMDLTNHAVVEETIAKIGARNPRIDVLVHSVAFSPREALGGRVVDVQEEGFALTMNISCYSLIRLVQATEHLLVPGASVMTVSYLGSQRVVKGYGIMSVAKAALESTVRMLAAELGEKGIRVNAISPGPIQTRAAGGVPGFGGLLEATKEKGFTHRGVTIEDCGETAVYLTKNRGVTGQTLYVDDGYSVLAY